MNAKKELREKINIDLDECLLRSAHLRLVEYMARYGNDGWFDRTLDKYAELKQELRI